MISAHTRRSFRELSRRRARSMLTILTIAGATAGIWLFSIPGNIESSLSERGDVDGMHTIRLAPEVLDLTGPQLNELRSTANVAALDVRTLGRTEMAIGERTQSVVLVGVADFASQAVNIVSVEEGALPARPGQLVTDFENARTGRYTGAIGDTVALRSSNGSWVAFDVVGRGGTLRYSSEVAEDVPFLYLSNADVQAVMGYPTPNSIDVIASNRAPAAVAAMVADLRTRLASALPNLAYWDVLEVWEEGTWPGSEDFENFVVLFYVIAGIALLSALVLIYTTMNTIVREQTREIGMMKAIGGTRRRIGLGYLRTSLLLGAAGTMLGIAIGFPLSNLLMSFMSSEFGGTSIGWQFSGFALVLSLVVGLGGTAMAAWPALHRAGRITVREAIEDHGVVSTYGAGPFDRAVARAGFLSRRNQLGLRNTTRRAGRNLATAIPIGLAVGTMLGFAAVSITALDETHNSQRLEGGDIIVWNNGGRGLDAAAAAVMESVPGVELAHQMIYSNVELGGEYYVWGLPAVSTYDHDILDGRWFTAEEDEARARVVVFGEAVAELSGTAVGDLVTVETRRGPIDLEVIGIDGHLVNDGQGMFMPIQTVFDYEGWTTGNYWVRTVSPDEATVDAAADGLHRTMRERGYTIGSTLRYISRNANAAENRLVVTVIMAMGLPIVAIGMIGLVNAMTSNILDRTREIGVLRSIGARRRDVRAMFRTEGMVIALVGWLLGIPIGYLVGRFIMWVLENEFHAAFDFAFPIWPILVALLATILVSLLVLRLPLRRAVRMSPGDALRYE
ncbi:MAG: FtsX-like permease family protein [Acidimicrobiia bacterium]|nr:FtsX-like permease family protein [Acidimicrobiia bacterium]MBT8246863.1 FtsX-like permease family protein [Acidimicrobiia bacterium]NNF87778.1 FtsX-like permease family protein [Acidimicrobiia bacterium]NNJ47281.1 FtsX-like permease family protein [Acidimicrobiia bacterium]NNL12757.1 FtsX-like permease family protein [Acidimicrobiia bacterium]